MRLLDLPGIPLIRRAGRRFGYEVVAYDGGLLSWWRTEVFRRERIGLVIDVGANTGQTGQRLRSEGYRGRIVSFEPLSAAFASLAAVAQSDPAWQVEQVALGERHDTITLHVSANGKSSSVLPMLNRQLRSAPESRYVTTEAAPLRRLDSYREDLALTSEPSLLKLDVQGYEDQVLAGATDALAAVRAIECELTPKALYESQPGMTAMIETLHKLGFVLVAVKPSFSDPTTGELLQLDGMFVRGIEKRSTSQADRGAQSEG